MELISSKLVKVSSLAQNISDLFEKKLHSPTSQKDPKIKILFYKKKSEGLKEKVFF